MHHCNFHYFLDLLRSEIVQEVLFLVVFLLPLPAEPEHYTTTWKWERDLCCWWPSCGVLVFAACGSPQRGSGGWGLAATRAGSVLGTAGATGKGCREQDVAGGKYGVSTDITSPLSPLFEACREANQPEALLWSFRLVLQYLNESTHLPHMA